MALVVDDRLKVWDERDQPRVHVVPAFAPYHAPQAEANSAVPVLCFARNVACNVRGGFFKDFDDGLLQRFNEVAYEDEVKHILPPDVSNYLVSEEDGSALKGSKEVKEPLGFDGMADVEVERRLKEAIASSTIVPMMPKLDPVLKTAFQYNPAPASKRIVPPGPIVQNPNKQLPNLLKPPTHVNRQETSLHSSPVREEGEVPESELDPDTRRRLLILQHGMDTRNQATSEPPQFPVRPHPMQVSAPRIEPHGGWGPLGEDTGPRHPMHTGKNHPLHVPPFVHKVEASILPDRVPAYQRLPKEVLQRDDRLRLSHSPPVHPSFPGEEGSLDNESGGSDTFAESPAEYLHYIASKCGTKVEFRQSLVPSIDLLFSFEVLFAGEKIGEGTGRTRREAQHHAAESSLMNLADTYLSSLKSGDEGRYISDGSSFGHQALLRDESTAFSTASVPAKPAIHKKGSIDALNELAAETAFQNLNSKIGQNPQKRQISSRSFHEMPAKRFRPEYPRVMQRMASSARYPKNASLVP